MVNKVESKLCETLKEVLSLDNWHIIGRFFILNYLPIAW